MASCFNPGRIPTQHYTRSLAIKPGFKTLKTPNSQPRNPQSAQEAVAWLKYTYMYGRMVKNPLAYGVTYEALAVSHECIGGWGGGVGLWSRVVGWGLG